MFYLWGCFPMVPWTLLKAPGTSDGITKERLPGSGRNALFIDGHVNDALNTPGVFYNIHTLKPNDTMRIERGDGTLYTYQVVRVEQKPIEQVDMAKMLRSADPNTEGLNLITCGGEYDETRQTYQDRILVYAVRSS